MALGPKVFDGYQEVHLGGKQDFSKFFERNCRFFIWLKWFSVQKMTPRKIWSKISSQGKVILTFSPKIFTSLQKYISLQRAIWTTFHGFGSFHTYMNLFACFCNILELDIVLCGINYIIPTRWSYTFENKYTILSRSF